MGVYSVLIIVVKTHRGFRLQSARRTGCGRIPLVQSVGQKRACGNGADSKNGVTPDNNPRAYGGFRSYPRSILKCYRLDNEVESRELEIVIAA